MPVVKPRSIGVGRLRIEEHGERLGVWRSGLGWGLMHRDPGRCGSQRVGIESAHTHPAASILPQQRRTLQHTQVLAHRRQRDGEGFGQFADTAFTSPQSLDHRPSGGVRQGGKYRIEFCDIMISHMVKYYGLLYGSASRLDLWRFAWRHPLRCRFQFKRQPAAGARLLCRRNQGGRLRLPATLRPLTRRD